MEQNKEETIANSNDQPLDVDRESAEALVEAFSGFYPGTEPKVLDERAVKLDHSTPLEGIGLFMACLGIFIIGITIYAMGEADYDVPGHILIGIGAVPLAIGFIIFKYVDIYYILDLAGRQFLLHRRIFRHISTRALNRFEHVDFVTVTAESFTRSSPGKSPTETWTYYVLMAFKNGTEMKVPGWSREFNACAKASRHLAAVLGARCIPGTPKRWVQVKKGDFGQGGTVEHLRSNPSPRAFYQRTDVLVMFCFLVLVFVMVGIFLKLVIP